MLGHAAHEGAVNFQGIGGQHFKVGKRGIARPEVIQGHPRTHRLQARNKRARRVQILQGDRFCNFNQQFAGHMLITLERGKE